MDPEVNPVPEVEATREPYVPEDSPADVAPPEPVEAQDPPADPVPPIAEPEIPSGLDLAGLQADYEANGGRLSDDAYCYLEAQGIPRALADDYIAGREAKMAMTTEAVAEQVGGRQRLDEILEWSRTGGIPDWEAQIIQRQVGEAGHDVRKLVGIVRSLEGRYIEEHGIPPKLIRGGGGTGQPGGFADLKEVSVAMRDPRYKTSAEYRAEVEARIKRSPRL